MTYYIISYFCRDWGGKARPVRAVSRRQALLEGCLPQKIGRWKISAGRLLRSVGAGDDHHIITHYIVFCWDWGWMARPVRAASQKASSFCRGASPSKSPQEARPLTAATACAKFAQ